jgi:hypothetical protein
MFFENKHALLAQCIEERAQEMRRPVDPAITVPKGKNGPGSQSPRAC